MQRDGSSSNFVDCLKFSNQRTLSLASMGTRVGFTFRFRALVPLNLLRVQNLIAASPSGNPSAVTARLACIQDAAQRVESGASRFVLPATRSVQDADRFL